MPYPWNPDQMLLVLVCAVLASLIGLAFAVFFETLIFLDTLGTAFIGLMLGPLWGAAFGALVNLVTGIWFPPYRKFLIVNAICGAVWGLLGDWLALRTGTPTELRIVSDVLIMGGTVGLISGLIGTAIRDRLAASNRSSSHILDQVGAQLRKQNHGYFVIAPVEFILSHLPDKTITSAVAVILTLLVLKHDKPEDLLAYYHDLVDILGAFYFVVFGAAVKKLQINFNQGTLFALLGPLGFFGVLTAAPAIAHLFI